MFLSCRRKSLRGEYKSSMEKYLLKNNNAKIGTGLIIGSTQRLLTPITKDDLGTIKINGVTWSVTTQDGSPLPADTMVEIVEIKGNKLIVKKNKDEKENI